MNVEAEIEESNFGQNPEIVDHVHERSTPKKCPDAFVDHKNMKNSSRRIERRINHQNRCIGGGDIDG